MIYEEKKFFDPENQWDRVPEWGDVAEHTDEATEVLDATTQTQLKDLALKVDIMNDNKEEEFADIDALFWAEGKINQLDDAKKNDALKYALKGAKIKMRQKEISVIKIAELFWKYVSQDGNWWRLTLSEIPAGDDKKYEEDLKTLVSSPKQSPLAYLIQKTSNFAKIQAENGYGRETEANKLREIREDKALGNQTRRALAWLRSWVEWWKIEDEKIPALEVGDVLNLQYISKETMDAIKEKSKNKDVKKLWDDLGKEDSKYEYRVPGTNNYALKLKWVEEVTENDEHAEVDEISRNNHELTEEEIQKIKPTKYEIPMIVETRDNVISSLQKECKDALKMDNWDNIMVTKCGTTKIYLWIVNWNTYWTKINIEIDAADCLNKDWTLNKDYVEKVILPKTKEQLRLRKQTYQWWAQLKTDKYLKQWYTKSDLFGNEYDWNPGMSGRLEKYFKLFDDGKLVLDDQFTYNQDKWTIKLEFDDDNWNEDYNMWQHNSDLEINAKDIMDDYKLNEEAVKAKFKELILKIINREDFK